MAVMLLLLLGCGPRQPCDGVRDLGGSPSSLELEAEEHRTGWGNDQCFQCHQVWTIHQQDCVDGVAVDVAAIAEVIDVTEPRTCVPCHGANGVPSLEPEDTGP